MMMLLCIVGVSISVSGFSIEVDFSNMVWILFFG